MKKQRMSFEDFLCERNDEIDNASFNDLSVRFFENTGKNIFWDMYYIAEINEAALSVLEDNELEACWPSYVGDDELPCIYSNPGEDCNCKQCRFLTGTYPSDSSDEVLNLLTTLSGRKIPEDKKEKVEKETAEAIDEIIRKIKKGVPDA